MFVKLVPNDLAIAEGSLFSENEVPYNHLYRIIEKPDSLCLKTEDGKVIFAQLPGQNGYIWLAKEIPPAKRSAILQRIASTMNELPGIVADSKTATEFAELYSKTNAIQYKTVMTTDAYGCTGIINPTNVNGKMLKATEQQMDSVTEYLAGFLTDAFGAPVDSASQIGRAKTMIEAGGLYLWMVNEQPVSMANIAHRSPRHARITAVYTPSEYRKNGYASMLVAELCSIIQSENLIPMLFADIKNPDSNKVYQNIGFVKSGQITELKFLR